MIFVIKLLVGFILDHINGKIEHKDLVVTKLVEMVKSRVDTNLCLKSDHGNQVDNGTKFTQVNRMTRMFTEISVVTLQESPFFK